jgi:hypothetical protein
LGDKKKTVFRPTLGHDAQGESGATVHGTIVWAPLHAHMVTTLLLLLNLSKKNFLAKIVFFLSP